MTIHHSRSWNQLNSVSHSRNQIIKATTIDEKTVQVQSKDHIIWGMPKTHVVIHRNYLKRLKNKKSQIDELHQSVPKKKYTITPLYQSICWHLH
jgi:hypothetical protein